MSNLNTSTITDGQLQHFKSGEVLKAEDLNRMVDGINNSVTRESHTIDASINVDSDPVRGRTLKVNVANVMPDAQAGSTSTGTSTLEQAGNSLRLFDSTGRYTSRKKIGSHLIEATLQGVLPETYSSIPVLQNNSLSAISLDSSLSAGGTFDDEIEIEDRIYHYTTTELSMLPESELKAIGNMLSVESDGAVFETSYANSQTNLKQNMVIAALADLNASEKLSGFNNLPNYRLQEKRFELGFDKNVPSYPKYYEDALSSTTRRLNYIPLNEIIDYFKTDTTAFGEYANSTMPATRSLYNPVQQMNGDIELSSNLLDGIRQGTQLYGFAYRTNYELSDNTVISSKYAYPYFHCDGVNDMLGFEMANAEGEKRERMVVPYAGANYAPLSSGDSDYVPPVGEASYHTQPDEITLANELGMVDVVVRVHDIANEDHLSALSVGLSSYGPSLSSRLSTLQDYGQHNPSPMVSYVPLNLVASTLNATIPIVSDIQWDNTYHRLVKYYYRADIKGGQIRKLYGSGQLSVTRLLDPEEGRLYEQLTELPLSTIVFQGVPEQI